MRNPDLPFIPARADRQGNPHDGTEFLYERDSFRPDWSVVFKMVTSRNPQRKEKKVDDWVPNVHSSTDYLTDKSKDWIVWLGHACYLIQIGGTRLLIDPQLADMPFVPRRFQLPFGAEDLTQVDYLLLSHDHRDHVDKDSISKIVASNHLLKILCPLGLTKTIQPWVDRADDLRGFGPTVIEEAAWFQVYDTEGTAVRITFLPSRHWCRRGLTDFNRTLWGSFMIERVGEPASNGLNTIYFGGDSAATAYWQEIGELYPSIDVAMLGIGAYAPAFMMQDNHANPEEAFRGFRDLGARYWWPMHHGTYDLSWEPAGEPVRRATAAMEGAGLGDFLLGAEVNFVVGELG
ncbi:hypothetical protein A3850_018685 [Lewinella sp. 4G2]|nr:hypothetical protein A3850_018685 [Lewinella sp. 4G2]